MSAHEGEYVTQTHGRPLPQVKTQWAGTGAYGYVSVGNQRDKGLLESGFSSEITAIYILKASQHLGIGRSLLKHGFHHLMKFGHISVSLWVLDTNKSARGFYEAMGGQLVSEREELRSKTTLREVAYGWVDLRSHNGADDLS